MKVLKTLTCVIAAAAAFATSTTFATSSPSTNELLLPTVNISGTVIYQASSVTNGTTFKGTLKTVSFNTKTLIDLLNASSYATNVIYHVTGSNSISIPAGSYFVWYIDDEELYITNKNGFYLPMEGYYYVGENYYYYDFGYLDFDADVLIGNASLNTTTWAGSEQDQTSIEFYFYDYNGNELEPEYGNGTMNWTYSPISNDAQKASINVSLQPAGYYAEVNDNDGITKGMNISGSSSGYMWALYEPFYKWW